MLGSSSARWSAKGIWFKNILLLSLSYAPHPPSLPCMASVQRIPRRMPSRWASHSGILTFESAITTTAVSSLSG